MTYHKKKSNSKNKDSLIKVEDLISSLLQDQKDMAYKICESFLKNGTRIFFGNDRLLTSTNSYYIQFPRNTLYDVESKYTRPQTVHLTSGPYYVESKRYTVSTKNSPYLPIVLYSIYLMLTSMREENNKKYISYIINGESENTTGHLKKIKQIKSVKSKIIILDTFTKLCEFSEALKDWQLPFCDITRKWHEIFQLCKKSACERIDSIPSTTEEITRVWGPCLTEFQKRNVLSGVILNTPNLNALDNLIKSKGLSTYDLSILSQLKKISEIQEDIILISENYQIDFTMDNFFDPNYQYYVFNCSQRTNKDFHKNISPYYKSKLDIIDEEGDIFKFPMYTDININIKIENINH